jgi:hypothetical protein
MAIDRTGRWWRGADVADLAEYLRDQSRPTFPVDRVVQSVCACGGTIFYLDGDRDQGCAQRTCVACEAAAFICDSGRYWSEAVPIRLRCRACRASRFEVSVGFSLREKGKDRGEVQWIGVADRCVRCGVLGSFVEWRVEQVPSRHLLEAT